MKEAKLNTDKLILKHAKDLADIRDKYELQVSTLKRDLFACQVKLKGFQAHMEGEMQVKEKIEERLTDYTEVLKREL